MLVDHICLVFDGSQTTRFKKRKYDNGSYSVQIQTSISGIGLDPNKMI